MAAKTIGPATALVNLIPYTVLCVVHDIGMQIPPKLTKVTFSLFTH
jgi:hypothetical protein